MTSTVRISSRFQVLPFENDKLLFRLALWMTTLPPLVTATRRKPKRLTPVHDRGRYRLRGQAQASKDIASHRPTRVGAREVCCRNNPPASMRYLVFDPPGPSSSSNTFKKVISVSSGAPSGPFRAKREEMICCRVSSLEFVRTWDILSYLGRIGREPLRSVSHNPQPLDFGVLIPVCDLKGKHSLDKLQNTEATK